MGSPVQPQAQQALGPLEVFIDTQLLTRMFMRCHLRDSMSDLQAKFEQEHLDCFPEHGIVRCKRLECNITFDNKSCSYAIPRTYRFSDLGAFAQGISENHLVFHMQVELCNSQVQLEGHQGSHAPNAPQLQSASQPPLALPAVAAQPAVSLQPAASASLQAQASVPLALEGPPAASASLQPHASVPLPEQPAEPEGRSKHKKRKRNAEAAEANTEAAEANVATAQQEGQAGDDEAEAHVSGNEGNKKKRRKKKKSRGPAVDAAAQADSAVDEEHQPAQQENLKRKHEAVTEEEKGAAAGMEHQPSMAAEEQNLPEAAQDSEGAAVAAPDAAAAAMPTEADDADAERDDTTSARNKKRKKKQKMRRAQARADAAIAALTAEAAAAAEAAVAAKGNTATDSKDVTAAAHDTDADADAPAGSIGNDDPVRQAGGKKKKKNKKRRSKLPDNEDDEEGAQQNDEAAGEAVETAAEESVPQIPQPGSSRAHRDAVHAEASEPNGQAAATANSPTASGLQQARSADHSSQKKKGKKSLAEAAAAYGMDLPPHLAGAEGNTGGLAAAATGNEAASAQGMDEEQPDPASSGWKMRRRELLPELDAAEDVPDPVMPPAASGGTSAEVVPPTASDPDTKAQVDAAIASVRKLANGQLDPDQAGPSNQAMGDTAASHGRAASDALAMMPAIPASTSGLVSPDDVSAQQPSGYGQSSSSDSGSKSDADPAAEKEGPGAAEMYSDLHKIWRELQGWQADAEARAAAGVEAKQAATGSISLSPSSSSSSEDGNQAQQQPAASGGEVNGDAIVPQQSGSDDSGSRDLGSDDSSSDDTSSAESEIPRPTVPSGQSLAGQSLKGKLTKVLRELHQTTGVNCPETTRVLGRVMMGSAT